LVAIDFNFIFQNILLPVLVLGLGGKIVEIYTNMPKIGWSLYQMKKRKNKDNMVLVWFIDDNLGMYPKLLTGELGQGILYDPDRDPGDNIYWIIPRPLHSTPRVTMINKEGEEAEYEILSSEDKRDFDSVLNFRHFIPGLNIPVLLVYTGKCIAVGPKTLAKLHQCLPRKEEATEEEKNTHVVLGTPLDARAIKQYFTSTVTPAAVQSLMDTHEKIGRDSVEPPKKKSPLGGAGIIIAVLVLFAIIFVVVRQAKMQGLI